MIKIEAMPSARPSDSELVTGSLRGNRDAFRQIVERYKTLVCSVAYCATGNLSQSEDLAQETFVTAWGKLGLLREPAKLRGWLCGIARHRTQKYWNRAGHELTHNAAPLEDASGIPSPEALPSDQAVTREEEAILWRSLAKIPEIYREPLILFYREHRSIEHVSVALELSEDAVKQRLSRGRKLLQEEVQAFVESVLRRTVPKPEFANAVVAALPLLTTPATAAAGWSATAKGAAVTKAGFLVAWVVPLIGMFGGFWAQWLVVRSTTSDRKTRTKQLRGLIAVWVLIIGIAVGGEWAVESMGHHFEWNERVAFAATAGFWWLFSCGLIAWIIAMIRRNPALREQPQQTGSVSLSVMKPGAYIAMIAGVYLSLGSWLIGLAWRAHDQLAVGVTAGTLLVLGAAHCCHVFRRTGIASARVSLAHTAFAGVAVVLIFNLRFAVWLASAHGVSVAKMYTLRPLWMIPTLTLAFSLWVGTILSLTKARHFVR
jgi:RNA polymerase sigma factor (sigma-70 family)